MHVIGFHYSHNNFTISQLNIGTYNVSHVNFLKFFFFFLKIYMTILVYTKLKMAIMFKWFP